MACDPPEHTRLRRMLAPEFAVKRLQRFQVPTQAIVAECLDAMEQAGPPVDLVQEFAQPISLRVLSELLAMPRADGVRFRRFRNEILNSTRSGKNRLVAINESWANITALVEHQRREPDDSLLGTLVREHGDELTDAELMDIGTQVLLAGYDNLAGMISLGTLLLLEHPDQLRLLRDSQQMTEAAVEEMIRYLSVVAAPQARTAAADVTVAGEEIKAGDSILCSLAAANRDDALGADMDRLDLARRPVAHVAFGYGIHYCLGANLARMAMRIAYPALFHRFPGLRLAVSFGDLRFRPVPAYSSETLPVAWQRERANPA